VSSRARLVLVGAVTIVVLAAVVGVGLLYGSGPVASAGPPNPLPAAAAVAGTASAAPCVSHVDNWGHSWYPAVFLVSVDPGPHSVTAVWWPTLNDGKCSVVATTGDRAIAGALATDIRQAPAIQSGTYYCPMDVGGAVDLYFSYARGRWQRVRVHPTGCGQIIAPGRRPRRADLDPELATIAPPGEWQRVLR
jgi:hypothetical protein